MLCKSLIKINKLSPLAALLFISYYPIALYVIKDWPKLWEQNVFYYWHMQQAQRVKIH